MQSKCDCERAHLIDKDVCNNLCTPACVLPIFSNIWHWVYIFLTIVLNCLVLASWKDHEDVNLANQGLVAWFKRPVCSICYLILSWEASFSTQAISFTNEFAQHSCTFSYIKSIINEHYHSNRLLNSPEHYNP